MRHLKVLFVMGLVATSALLTSCSSDDGSSVIYYGGSIPSSGDATGFYGSWSIGEQVMDQAYVWDCDTALRMGNMPLVELISPLVTEGEQRNSLINTIWHLDYNVPIEQTGYSEDATYFRIPQKKFILYAEYDGAEHEITIISSPANSTMMRGRNNSSLTILLRITEIWIDNVVQKTYDPELTLNYTSSRRIN